MNIEEKIEQKSLSVDNIIDEEYENDDPQLDDLIKKWEDSMV